MVPVGDGKTAKIRFSANLINTVGRHIIVEVSNLATVEMTKMSSRGQVVIPQDIRDNMNLKEGESFAVVASGDTLLLKRIATPSKEEILREWKRVAAKGRGEAKKLGIRQGDVGKAIHGGRQGYKEYETVYFDAVEKRIREQDKEIAESGGDYYVYD